MVEQCPTPISSTDSFKPTTMGSRKLGSGDKDATLTRKAQTIGVQNVVAVAKPASSVVELEIPGQTSDCS